MLYRVIADGIAWVDGDGRSLWPQAEADTLAAGLERMGYTVDVQAEW